MDSVSIRQLFQLTGVSSHVQFPSSSLIGPRSLFVNPEENNNRLSRLGEISGHHNNMMAVPKATPANKDITPAADEDEEGVSLGTMKLPLDTDLSRFETLLFQWANSLCQGANLPLPVPLKVDKIPGRARLGFITIGDGVTEVPVFIDCLVFPTADGSAPIFRAVRNGPMKDQSAPGEPRIMKSLLAALQKSVEIARL